MFCNVTQKHSEYGEPYQSMVVILLLKPVLSYCVGADYGS